MQSKCLSSYHVYLVKMFFISASVRMIQTNFVIHQAYLTSNHMFKCEIWINFADFTTDFL